jgi:hypothetical protein
MVATAKREYCGFRQNPFLPGKTALFDDPLAVAMLAYKALRCCDDACGEAQPKPTLKEPYVSNSNCDPFMTSHQSPVYLCSSRRRLVLLGALTAICLNCSISVSAASERYQFACEQFTAASGALYRASGGNADYSDSVKCVHVDLEGRVWVGTVTGLAVYDGKQWQTRTFLVKHQSRSAKVILGFFGIHESGPDCITHGPGGEIWLCGGGFGVWKYAASEYTEIDPTVTSRVGIAADRSGNVYVVEKYRVQRYDGSSWASVLDPFVVEPNSNRPDGFNGIEVDGHDVVWIGANRHGKPAGQSGHDGPIWTVSPRPEDGGLGPPKAPLFAFDGRGWRAFGASDGLDFRWCHPRLNREHEIRINTPDGVFRPQGQTWVPSGRQYEVYSGKHWLLREAAHGEGELVYLEGDKEIVVKQVESGTGELLDFSSERLTPLSLAEDRATGRAWLGTWHGLYLIWRKD